MSKYSKLADALIVSPPHPAPDVVTLVRAAAALRELESRVVELTDTLREVEEIATNPIMNDLEVGFLHRPLTNTEIIDRAKHAFQTIKAITGTVLNR